MKQEHGVTRDEKECEIRDGFWRIKRSKRGEEVKREEQMGTREGVGLDSRNGEKKNNQIIRRILCDFLLQLQHLQLECFKTDGEF